MFQPEIIAAKLRENNVLLAPMAGVTDRFFRSLCKEQNCGMTYTEMVSAKGLYYGRGQGNSKKLLILAENEEKAVIQIFGNDPRIMAEQAEKICEEMGERVAWIDINMGCPAPKITRNGEGSALMKMPDLAFEIVKCVNATIPVPLSVKFRIGWDDTSVNALQFAQLMEKAGASAICVHGRTRQQFYSGEANWDVIGEIKQNASIPVIGNGDIFSADDAKEKMEKSGVDAVMVARGAQGNPWIFSQIRAYLDEGKRIDMPSSQDRVEMALRHTKGLMQFRGIHAIKEMRKHVSWYISGLKGAAKMRNQINQCETFDELKSELMALLGQQIDCVS